MSRSLSITEVTASTFSESNPAHSTLFGPLRNLVATSSEKVAYKHPRIVLGPTQWDELISMYADERTFSRQGTWSHYFRSATLRLGLNSFIQELANSFNDLTTLYKPQPYSDTTRYQMYRQSLKPLAELINMSNSGNVDAFPLCALWASVALKRSEMKAAPFIPVDTYKTCIRAASTWSTIVLAHRTYHCNPECSKKYDQNTYAHLWSPDRLFNLEYNWVFGGTGIGFVYDLLFDYIEEKDRVRMRSALAMFVLNREAWGATETSTRSSPNAKKHPHRIFSNWAGYHSNLFLANLAIEGEEGIDEYAASALAQNGQSTAFNKRLHELYSELLKQFIHHSFYPDGSTFEDGYSYFLALREGSLGLLATHRRGSNVLGTPRFRNIIHNAAQMFEPWQCGELIGHSSGGGNEYNAYAGLFKYSYPHGELPGMIWRQRFGDFQANRPCRNFWTQSVLQLMFLGGEHSSNAESPGSLNLVSRQHFKLSYYAARRGLLISRTSLSEKATYMHFDARPDAFFAGHDNADRGTFTFTALRQTWFDDLHWRSYPDSRQHSLMHVDGLAQNLRAPSVRMLEVKDNGYVVQASADLTYAYNVQWAPNHNYNTPPTHKVPVYNDTTGAMSQVSTTFHTRELLDPWSLGWPDDDKARDIGFRDDMVLHYEDNIGFMGLWLWKRNYRKVPLSYMVRSMILVRSSGDGHGYGVIVDSVAAGPGLHVFDSYLILNSKVRVMTALSRCTGNACKISLSNGNGAMVDIHVFALGNKLAYRTEVVGGENQRIIVSSAREVEEQFWIIMHGHERDPGDFSVSRSSDHVTTISYEGGKLAFTVNRADHTIKSVKPRSEQTPESDKGTNRETEGSNGGQVAAPMAPRYLNRKVIMRAAAMKSTKESFYEVDTAAPFQVVLNFTSQSNAARRLQDKFVTCSVKTTVTTEMSVYDCGNDEMEQSRYLNRRCTLVSRSTAQGTCRLLRTRFKSKLAGGKRYILVVSITPTEKKPFLILSHLAAK